MKQSMPKTQLHMEITSLEQLADVIECLQGHLGQWNVAEEKQIDLKLCIMEAVQNALLYGGDESTLPTVQVRWSCDAEGFCFTVEDNGSGIPQHLRSESYEEGLRESGRGLLLMRSILDELRFNEKGNAVTGILRW